MSIKDRTQAQREEPIGKKGKYNIRNINLLKEEC